MALRSKDKFAVFILTHGRPDDVLTVEALRRSGYTGKTYFLIDNEDKKADAYRARFGDENVIVFDKLAVSKTFDIGDSLPYRKSVVYARNSIFAISKELGLDYFLQLDDDYTFFAYRWVEDNVLLHQRMLGFDKVVDLMLDFLEDTGAYTVSMSQGGDHMGGVGGPIKMGLKRKAMNSFFCRTDKPFVSLGRLNDDVNTYVVYGASGGMFWTVLALQLNQTITQHTPGGMTEYYRESGTYVKSFYTVMMAPSCVTIKTLGITDRRFHHSIRWNNAVPKILSPIHKK